MTIRNHVVVVGSLNADLVARVERQPDTGETVPGWDFQRIPGGKGLNQAIATARAGANVTMIGAVGNDDLAKMLKRAAEDSGINTDHIREHDGPSGIAIISVANDASNRIIVIPGANETLTRTRIEETKSVIQSANVVVAQLETPIDGIHEALRQARSGTAITVLNPAPVIPIPDELYALTNYLIVNEYEAGLLAHTTVSNQEDAKQAANILIKKGATRVIVTLGANGSIIADQYGSEYFPPYEVNAVDTTAAGDSFVGNFAASLAKGMQLDSAMKRANAAGAICATRPGAAPSIPTGKEVNDFVLQQDGFDIPQ